MEKLLQTLFFLSLILSNSAIANVVNEELTGFKKIKFSFTAKDLSELGASCVGSLYCTLYKEDLDGITFLNQPVLSPSKNSNENIIPVPEFTVYFSDISPYHVAEIHVYINLSGYKVTETLTTSLGPSIKWLDWEYWFFSNGAMISTYNPEDNFFPSKTLYRPASQAYKSFAQIMPKSLKPSIIPSDF
jgi:hypothetical protein